MKTKKWFRVDCTRGTDGEQFYVLFRCKSEEEALSLFNQKYKKVKYTIDGVGPF